MTKSVASNGHANNHPRNCKYKPQTASVEGKPLWSHGTERDTGMRPSGLHGAPS